MAQQSAFLMGAERVIAIDRFPERLRVARENVLTLPYHSTLRHYWAVDGFWMSSAEQDMVNIPRVVLQRFTGALAYAA